MISVYRSIVFPWNHESYEASLIGKVMEGLICDAVHTQTTVRVGSLGFLCIGWHDGCVRLRL